VHRFVVSSVILVLTVVLVALGTGVIEGGASPKVTDQTSSVAAAPDGTPTYVSELGPAVSRPPRHANLPPTGTGEGASFPWTVIAGAALTAMGAGLIHIGLAARRSPTA
jgi:hypothetical protein